MNIEILEKISNKYINLIGISKLDLINAIVNKHKSLYANNISNKELNKQLKNLLLNDNMIDIYNLKTINKLTFKEISNKYNLSTTRINQICEQVKQHIKKVNLLKQFIR